MSEVQKPNPASVPAEPPKGALLAIFLIILVDFLGFGLIIPLLPFYVPGYRDHAMQVTMIFAIYSICQFIGAPILGAMSDRYGRRPVLIYSQIGSAVGYLILAIAAMGNWSDSMRLTLVYISRIVDGFTGGNVSTAQAYISDVTTAKNRAKGMGLIGAAFGIGFSLGPFLGGVLQHHVSKTAPAYAAAALALVAALQTYLRLPESPIHKPTDVKLWLHPSKFAPAFRNPIVSQLLFISFISMAAFVMMESVIGLFLAKIYNWTNPDEAALKTGYFFGFVGVVIIIIQGGLIGRLTKKRGEWPLAILGPLLVVVGMAFYSWSAWQPLLWILGMGGILNATGRSLQMPTVSSLLSKHSDPKEQGIVFGLYHGMSSLARVIGPIIAGLMYPFMNNTGPFWTAAVIVAIAAVWTASLARSKSVREHRENLAATPVEALAH